ncbi:unnamed protein product [Schistosoma mattheei]|uniref:Uncharacterized protein n=1 Tax=Schistosoma mattheei TaxID=31246 RepID=A0A183PQ06_9TREM|nr:unnamed protein product [Schistosoma mattheei]
MENVLHNNDNKSNDNSGSIIDEHGETDTNVKMRIGKARAGYLQLKIIWKSKQLFVNQHQGQNFQYKCEDSSTV